MKSIPQFPDEREARTLENILREAESFHAAGDHLRAASLYRAILAENPRLSRTAYNLGNILKDQEQYAEAEEWFCKALAAEPDLVEAALNQAFCLQEQGRISESIAACGELVRQHPELPDPRFNLACLRLLNGELPGGWSDYELRFFTQQPVMNRHAAIPRWDGIICPGLRLLVHTEQGYGDALQMIRYLPLLTRAGLRIWLETSTPLAPLLERLPGLEGCLLRGVPLPPVDAQVPIMSLPGLMRTTLETIPPLPQLEPDEELVDRMAELLPAGGALRVGLAWAGRLDLPVNRKRSCPAPLIATLLDIPDITFVSLHQETPEQFSLVDPRLLNLEGELHDFHHTAALIANLDLVVTIDTAVAHLAGTLGKPTWLLLPFVPDWRWLLECEDSPWYPSMRLLRQPHAGDWETPLSEVGRELAGRLPQAVQALINLGAALDNRGRHEEALACYQAAIARDGDMAIAHYNMGNTLKNLKHIDQAQHAYERALELDPRIPEAHHNLAIIHQELGELQKAHRRIDLALELRPRFSDALHTRGELLQAEERFEEAVEAFQAALRINPRGARTWNSLGIVYQSAEHDREAEICYRQALEHDPDHLHALNNLGAVCLSLGRPEEGIEHLQRLVALTPDYADGHWNLSCCLLACGRYREGWGEYEWRWRKHSPIQERHRHIPLWDGSPLAGRTILLWAEQGFGDTIQFIRFVSLVAKQAERVVIECQSSALTLLLESAVGAGAVIARGEPLPDVDCQAPLLSLPRLLGITLETLPSSIPYLGTPEGRRRRWANLIPAGEHFRAGLVWGGRQTLRNRRRSCRLDDFAPLGRLAGITWYSLQVGDQAVEAATPPPGMALRDLTPHIADFADTAAIMERLDLIVTIDTSVAHLAGAMGKPVIVLLPVAADWRWLTGREDSPWYPTMRLLRQEVDGGWEQVIDRLSRELEMIAARRGNPEVAVCLERGDSCRQEEAWEEAHRWYLLALARDPLDWLACLRAGASLIFLNRHAEAKVHLQRAIELAPEEADAHVNLAIAHLATGCLREGWEEFEWRRRYIGGSIPSIPELPPLKPGERLEGATILVHMEQGFGDMLQFVRYVPLLAGLGGRVVLSVPQELVRLFHSCAGIELIVPHGEHLPATDFQTLLMSLPHLMAAVAQPEATDVPYLAAEPQMVEEWRCRLEGLEGVRIGLAWQGRDMNKSGYRRSLSLEQLAPLLAMPGCSFVTLLPGSSAEAAAYGTICDCSPYLGDFADTAALIANLDLVITIDTAVAHLAGALGRACWVALLHAPDWRWHPFDRKQSGWYPSLRLFRQAAPGEWGGVVSDLCAALKPEILIRRGNELGSQGRRQEAIELFQEAAAVPDPSAAAWLNLGIYLDAEGRTAEGRDALKRAVALDPAYPEAYQNLGLLHQALGELAEAYICFRRALSLRPGYDTALWNLGLLQLLLGEYREGFKNIEARFRKTDPISLRHADLPCWNGEDIRGKTLLVHAEQGYGDTIQFLRYVPLLAERGTRVSVEVQDERLRGLANSVRGVERVIIRGESCPATDFQIPMISLAHVFGTVSETIPSASYCTPDEEKSDRWRERLESYRGLKIGLVWAGSRTLKADKKRSIPFRQFGALLDVQGVTFFSLQIGPDALTPEGARISGNSITDLTPYIHDFSDTAAFIANLDLVISVDTATAHLAGALGKPVWVLAYDPPEWRWMRDREDTPWYPSMRLFRQDRSQEWPPVLERVRRELAYAASHAVVSHDGRETP
ncbi:tetratricopeptide repeat protein [Geobacter sp. SVR]|uniref:tetratricopeptide repeat protein n=1 Tax=Geobacter sp. SVR TaxID=2495594 RepID=UPI00143EF7B2|nr:tetratricopeptide repeat protein [Geobacter sp. SVR]BCS55996.1 hypothetical protein GSVR_43040 [Geobacter sp. SVR]GCF84759.1 hypothetical protein GSbR_13590 [Geobacter sp. SVR]